MDDAKKQRLSPTGAVASDYSVVYLVAKTGISQQQAIALVDHFGSVDFDRLELEAKKLFDSDPSA